MTLTEARAAHAAAYEAKGIAARDLALARRLAPDLLPAARRAFNAASRALAQASAALRAAEGSR